MPTEFPKFSKPQERSTFTVDVETKAVEIESKDPRGLTFTNECIWMALYHNALEVPREAIQSALSYSNRLQMLKDNPDWAPGPAREISLYEVEKLVDKMEGSPADLFIKTLVKERNDHVDAIHGSLREKLDKLFTLSYGKYRTCGLEMGGGHPALEKQNDDRYWRDLAEKNQKKKDQQEKQSGSQV
ncbi:MAG: hypothetical protein Q9173_001686 [Seirophora scorigena]